MSCNGNCSNCWHKGLCDEQDTKEYERTDEYGIYRNNDDDDDEYGGY